MADKTTDKADVRERMLALLEDVCGDPAVRTHVDEDLFELGLLDSMAAIEFLVSLEDEMERSEMNTTNKIVAQVEKRL